LFASIAWLAAAPPAAAQRSDQERSPEAAPEYTYQTSSIQMPRLLNPDEITPRIAARFPPALRDRGISSGSASLRFRILADGTVDSASITVEGSSNPAFVEPATAIAPRMRFAPAKLEGRTVPGWIRYDLDFRDSDEAIEGHEMPALEELPVLRNRGEVARHNSALYPPDLRDSGVEGAVIVRFRISEDGTVDPGTITVPVMTDLAFEEPAITVVRRMRFTPAKVGGRPVALTVTIPVEFRVE
jgi:TonB family protein